MTPPLATPPSPPKVLYGDYGFSGNEQDYYNPENCYINRVLDGRKGGGEGGGGVVPICQLSA